MSNCLIIPKKLAGVGYATFPRWKVIFLFVYLEGNFPPFFTPLRWQKNRLKTEEGSASYQDTHSKKGSKFNLARIYEMIKDIERVNNTNETNLVLTKFRIKSANGKERVSVSTLCR